MPQRQWSLAAISRRIRQGYGTGARGDYKPWLRFTDPGSRGNFSFTFSPLLNRSLLFFSQTERNAYYVAERERVADFQEQFPLDPEETWEIAHDLGIKHPLYRFSSIPAVLTLDALAYSNDGFIQVLDSKWANHVDRTRVQELRAIRDVYAARRGWSVLDLTQHDFPRTLVQNLQWIREVHEEVGKLPLDAETLAKRDAQVYDGLGNSLAKRSQEPIHHFLARQDRRFEFSGVALFALRRVLWQALVDFAVEKNPFRSLLRQDLTQLWLPTGR